MIIKKIANKILKTEIDELKQKIEEQRKENYELIQERANDAAKDAKHLEEIRSKNNLIKKLTDENDLLKKYYHLDSEPTDQEKIQIHIDLKIHDLEMALIQERIKAFAFERPRYLITNPYSSIYQAGMYARW